MEAPLTTGTLYNTLKEKLVLDWLAGRAGADRVIKGPVSSSKNQRPVSPLVGHLNLIHPNRIQVIGRMELRYLRSLGKNSFKDTLDQLFANEPALLVISNGKRVPKSILDFAEASDTPLFQSRLPGHKLVTHLHYYLSGLLAEKITLHGVFMEVMGIGVLLTGESGVGKSELALELVTRGHRLIADDAPEFLRIAPDKLNGVCPQLLQGFLEVRGIGILNIKAMYGDSAVKQDKNLRLIIHLQELKSQDLKEIDRLYGSKENTPLLEVNIPKITIPVAPGRNLAVLIESAVRNHLLELSGYSASTDFIHRHREVMGRH